MSTCPFANSSALFAVSVKSFKSFSAKVCKDSFNPSCMLARRLSNSGATFSDFLALPDTSPRMIFSNTTRSPSNSAVGNTLEHVTWSFLATLSLMLFRSILAMRGIEHKTPISISGLP